MIAVYPLAFKGRCGTKRVTGNSHNCGRSSLYVNDSFDLSLGPLNTNHLPDQSSQLTPDLHFNCTSHTLPSWRQLKAPSPGARKSREYEWNWIQQRCSLIYVQSALVTYVTAGFPTAEETPDIMLAMEAGGAGTMPLLTNSACRYSCTPLQT